MNKQSVMNPKTFGELVYSDRLLTRYRHFVDYKRSQAINRVLYPVLALCVSALFVVTGAAYMKRQAVMKHETQTGVTMEAMK